MSIKAMKLALEELEGCYVTFYEDEDIAEAITALRQAIEQAQSERPAPCARHCEADAFQIEIRGLKARLKQANVATNDTSQERVDETAKQRHEPVNKYCCHLCFNKSGQMFLDRMILCPECGNKRCPKATNHELQCTNSNEPNQTGSIYTFSPQRQPLSFEQVEDCFPEGYSSEDNGILVSAQWLHDFARAIEAAHGIKGEA